MYRSPIELIYQGIEMKIEKGILKAVHKQDINVDREELIRALEYDRGQYEKGYSDALDSIVRCKDCKYYVWDEFDGCNVCICMSKYVKPDFWCAHGERKDNADDKED